MEQDREEEKSWRGFTKQIQVWKTEICPRVKPGPSSLSQTYRGGTGQRLVGWLLHSSLLMTKENQLPLGLTRTCELFSLREDTSCWGPQESLRVAGERGINELCHFAVTWKGITTYHKQHLGDLTVQIGKEWKMSKPWWCQWSQPKPELAACSLQEVLHHNCNSRDKQHTHLYLQGI